MTKAKNKINFSQLGRSKKINVRNEKLKLANGGWAGADPGFPVGGDANLRFCQKFPKKTRMKLRRAGNAPPLPAPFKECWSSVHCAEIVIGLEANGAFILPDTRHIQMPTKLATILYKQFLPVSISVYASVNTNYYFIRNKRCGSNHTNRYWDLQKMACIELHGVVHTAPRHWYYLVL